MSCDLHTRPSDLLGIDAGDDPALAFMVDRAVWAGGNAIESEIRRAEERAIAGKARPEQVADAARGALERCLNADRARRAAARARVARGGREITGARYSLKGGRLAVIGIDYSDDVKG